jgi:DNA polymerase
MRCSLYCSRTNVAIQRGNPFCPLWYVGEAPGKDEDRLGQPFVGRAGRLLNQLNRKAGIRDGNIVNLLKCRPPDNRDPDQSELNRCTSWLQLQLEEYNPRVIVAMGRYSIGHFRQYDWKRTQRMAVTKEARSWFQSQYACNGQSPRVVIPTVHPAYLLRNSDAVLGFLTQLKLARTWYARFQRGTAEKHLQ